MRVLNIFDVSACAHIGNANKYAFIRGPILAGADGYREAIIKTGGIAQILNILKSIDNKDTCVFTMDTMPTEKQHMYTAYKGNRSFKLPIQQQKDVIEMILTDCGFTILKEDGFEADDLIYSLVEKHAPNYDLIRVYTEDSDQYFLVRSNVEILPISSRGKHITFENYELNVSKKYRIPYNTVTYNKILSGDTSDNIPPLPKILQGRLSPITTNSNYYPLMGNKAFMRDIIASICEEALPQFDLVFPLTVDVPDEITDKADWRKVSLWGGIVGAKNYQRIQITPEAQKHVIDEMLELQLYED